MGSQIRKACSRCKVPHAGISYAVYCAVCRLAYQRERAASNHKTLPCATCGVEFKQTHGRHKRCEACRGRKNPTTCQECSVPLAKGRRKYCEGCARKVILRTAAAFTGKKQREMRAANPRICPCGQAIPPTSKAQRCDTCRAPKPPQPSLVDMVCQGCGKTEHSSRNMVLCRACRKEADREYQRDRERKKTAERRAKGKLCACGAPLPTMKRRACDECLREKERDKNKQNEHRRRALKKGSKAGTVSYKQLWANSGGMCNQCRVAVDRTTGHVDHIIALARGGPHRQENLQILCGPCNLRKWHTVDKSSSASRTLEAV